MHRQVQKVPGGWDTKIIIKAAISVPVRNREGKRCFASHWLPGPSETKGSLSLTSVEARISPSVHEKGLLMLWKKLVFRLFWRESWWNSCGASMHYADTHVTSAVALPIFEAQKKVTGCLNIYLCFKIYLYAINTMPILRLATRPQSETWFTQGLKHYLHSENWRKCSSSCLFTKRHSVTSGGKGFCWVNGHIHLKLMVFFGFRSWGNSNALVQKVWLSCLNRGIQHHPETPWVNALASSCCVSWLWIPSRFHVIPESPTQVCLIAYSLVSNSIRPPYLVDRSELRG